MRSPIMRLGLRILPLGLIWSGLLAENVAPAPTQPSKVEPGLEEAVHWKWKVMPAVEKDWGMPLPESLKPKDTAAAVAKPAVAEEARPTAHEVVKGDALAKIARKYRMTTDQLKRFNGLKDDRIVIGQILNIPTAGELLAMPPPPPEVKPESKGKKPKDGEKTEDAPVAPPMTYEQLELETVLLQVFLDREMFSPGGIDGKEGPWFQKICQFYQQSHPDSADLGQMKAKALAAVKQPYATYVLRAEDFKFIKPAGGLTTSPSAKKGSKVVKSASSQAPLTYQELVGAEFLAYAGAWEFVAERFHCDEGFLRRLNPNLGETPAVGAEFQVPNVVPFEIEKAFDEPLRPSGDPQKPVTAVVVELSRLEISSGGQLVAVMPLASARPGLRGRGSWIVLDAIPRPRMVTRREPRETPKAADASAVGSPAATPPLGSDEFLSSGPNNPVGVIWINLAKTNSSEPLPYGLHGTGIPARMRSQEGIGGFRLTNWDIARAVRLMPVGTVLQWKGK